ncbi:MAG: phosphoribosylformylglycinamidine cyclo-ligase [Candidatus Thermoplasmatota archaeon]
MTYRDSGVDIEKEEKAIKEMLTSFKAERKGLGEPLGGHYAGMVDFGEHALVMCTDGVGSKVLIANQMRKWNTVGIDCIAMNVNDAVCVGAEPIAFVDYLAIDKPEPEKTKEIGEGLQKGAEHSNISIIGGETASLPEIVNGFDLAGTCLAFLKKDQIVTGEKIKPGDKIIGLSSSGIHSNGLTLARKVVEENNYSYDDSFPEDLYPGKKIGEILLTPTQIYVKEILKLFEKIHPHGLAHITGGGLRNFSRLNKKVKYVLNDLFEPQPIFDFIQQQGNVETKEMYQTFNMGMGFAVIVSSQDEEETISILEKYSDSKVKTVGEISKGEGVEANRIKF